MLPSIRIVGLVSLVLGASIIAGVYLHNTNTFKKKTEVPRIATIRSKHNNADKNKVIKESISPNRPDSVVDVPNMVKYEESSSKMYSHSSYSDDRKSNMYINQEKKKKLESKKNNVCYGLNEVSIWNVDLSKDSKNEVKKSHPSAFYGIHGKQEALTESEKQSLLEAYLEAIRTEELSDSLYTESSESSSKKSEVLSQPNPSAPGRSKITVNPEFNESFIAGIIKDSLARAARIHQTQEQSRPSTPQDENQSMPSGSEIPENIVPPKSSASSTPQDEKESNPSTPIIPENIVPPKSSASSIYQDENQTNPSESEILTGVKEVLDKQMEFQVAYDTVNIGTKKPIEPQHTSTEIESTNKAPHVPTTQQDVRENNNVLKNSSIEEEEKKEFCIPDSSLSSQHNTAKKAETPTDKSLSEDANKPNTLNSDETQGSPESDRELESMSTASAGQSDSKKEDNWTYLLEKLRLDLIKDGLIRDPNKNKGNLKKEDVKTPPQLNVTNPTPTDGGSSLTAQLETVSSPEEKQSQLTEENSLTAHSETASNTDVELLQLTDESSSGTHSETASNTDVELLQFNEENSSGAQSETASNTDVELPQLTDESSSGTHSETASNTEGEQPQFNEENSSGTHSETASNTEGEQPQFNDEEHRDSTSAKDNAKKVNISVSDMLTIQKVFKGKSVIKWSHLLHAVNSPNKDSLSISIKEFNKSMQDPIMHMLRYNRSYIEIANNSNIYPKTIDMRNLANTLDEYIKTIEKGENYNSDVLRNMKSIVFHTILLNSLLETSSKSILKEGDMICNLRRELDNEIEDMNKELKQNKNNLQLSNVQKLKKGKIKAVLNKAQDQLQLWKEESKKHAEEIEKSVSNFMKVHNDLGNIDDFNLSEIVSARKDNHSPAAATPHNKTSFKDFFSCTIQNLLVPKAKKSKDMKKEVKTTITFDEMSTKNREKTSVISYLLKDAAEKRCKLSKSIGSIFFEECSGFISNCNPSRDGGSTLDLGTGTSALSDKHQFTSIPAMNSIPKTLPSGELYILSPNKILTFSASVLANIESLLSKIEKNAESKKTWCDLHTNLIALVRFTMCIFANASLEQCNLLMNNRVNSNMFSIVYKLLFNKNTVTFDMIANSENTINMQKHVINKNPYFEHNGLNNRSIDLWSASALNLKDVDYIKNILKLNNRKKKRSLKK
ncbi:hypothetical protein NEAUS03_0634 [Nematocida ausubeli]|nr:hypothetical protein NEAUS03_0634 [Nematocida ausubeli]